MRLLGVLFVAVVCLQEVTSDGGETTEATEETHNFPLSNLQSPATTPAEPAAQPADTPKETEEATNFPLSNVQSPATTPADQATQPAATPADQATQPAATSKKGVKCPVTLSTNPTDLECQQVIDKSGLGTTVEATPKANTEEEVMCLERLRYKCGAVVVYARVESDDTLVKLTTYYPPATPTTYYAYADIDLVDQGMFGCTVFGVVDVQKCMSCFIKSNPTMKDNGPTATVMASTRQVLFVTLLQQCGAVLVLEELPENDKIVKITITFKNEPKDSQGNQVTHYMYTEQGTASKIAGYVPLKGSEDAMKFFNSLFGIGKKEDSTTAPASDKTGEDTAATVTETEAVTVAAVSETTAVTPAAETDGTPAQ